MIELVKLPEPVPFVVMLFEIVGGDEIFQQTPRAVTAAPPSLVIVPPLVAVVCVIADAAVVVRTGTVDAIEGVTEFEAELATLVPIAFVAVTVKV